MRARDILGPGGPLASRLPNYEPREAQLAMADAVERALEGDRRLVVEAGTGTGKTLAYLVPALLSGRKVVISTATKALQEQIFTKDLPLLAEHAGLAVNAVLVKGLGNYLCRRRFEAFRGSAEALRPSNARPLAMVESWVHETESGDLAELAALAEDHPMRGEIASSSETRIGPQCPFHKTCFVTQMRREAEGARLLVVNHHLLFADLALRGPGSNHAGAALPPYDSVIFDEAHQLEDIATDFFGTRVSSSRSAALLRDAGRVFAAAGLGDRLLSRSDASILLDAAASADAELFAEIARMARDGAGRVPLPKEIPATLRAAHHRFDGAMLGIESFAEANEHTETVAQLRRRTRLLRDDLAHVLDDPARHVSFAEVSQRATILASVPIDVSSVLKERLFDVVPSAVLTSATLQTQNGFAFLRARVGLTESDAPIDELALPSPFDFERRALLYVPTDLPEVSDPRFATEAAARIAELVAASGGGAFVLCTSIRSMRALHDGLRRAKVRDLYLQGDAPKTALLGQFRAHGDATLVATMGFWEGVDVPGDALRLVILDKLPFPVPSDPIVAARSAAIEATGESSFARYQVPTAAIALKQGFGRLVRTEKDRGVVAVLDRRLVTKGYGKQLLKALPPARRTSELEDVKAFFRSDA